jgi:hypothetical protein
LIGEFHKTEKNISINLFPGAYRSKGISLAQGEHNRDSFSRISIIGNPDSTFAFRTNS